MLIFIITVTKPNVDLCEEVFLALVSKQWSNRTSISHTDQYSLVIMTTCVKPTFSAVLESDEVIRTT